MDLTVVATPGYFATMGAEYRYLKKRAERDGPSAADYEKNDTIASLTMGVASLVVPFVIPKLLRPITPGKGKLGKALVATAAAAVAVTTIADAVARRNERDDVVAAGEPEGADAPPIEAQNGSDRRRTARLARRIAGAGGVAAVVVGGLAITTTLASRLTADRMWKRRRTRDLGTGPLAVAARGARVGLHLLLEPPVHAREPVHVGDPRRAPLERALQPVDGAAPARRRRASARSSRTARSASSGSAPSSSRRRAGVNLLYQYWIHTDTIRRLGPFEQVLNTPSHHRVHHGSNPQYLDRNHGSILIVWDKLFGTFEPEGETVVYGLTKNIDTFNPGRIATHEHADMLRDVAHSTTWRERLSYVVRGPGWAYERHKARAGGEAPPKPHAVG